MNVLWGLKKIKLLTLAYIWLLSDSVILILLSLPRNNRLQAHLPWDSLSQASAGKFAVDESTYLSFLKIRRFLQLDTNWVLVMADILEWPVVFASNIVLLLSGSAVNDDFPFLIPLLLTVWDALSDPIYRWLFWILLQLPIMEVLSAILFRYTRRSNHILSSSSTRVSDSWLFTCTKSSTSLPLTPSQER